MNDSRDDVRAAIADLKTETTNETPTEAGADVAAPVDAGGGDSPAEVRAPDAVANGGDRPSTTEGGRVRGPDGKFAKKPEPTGTKPPEAAKPTETKASEVAPATQTAAPTSAVTTPTFRAPQSWKADVRELFAKADPAIQAEVTRREQEIQQTLQAVAPAKRIHEAVAPFEAAFKAQGADVAQALPGILQTVQRLATGHVQDKAAILGNMVRTYLGGDQEAIKLLAQHIDGTAPTPQRQQTVDPNTIAAQVRAQIQAEQVEAQVQTIAQQFEAEPREFLEDVQPVMAAIIQAARGRGEPPSLKLVTEAYEQACWATPSVRKVLEQRAAQQSAQATQAAATKARAAAVSARPAPTVAPPRESSGTSRDDIRATIAELSGRT